VFQVWATESDTFDPEISISAVRAPLRFAKIRLTPMPDLSKPAPHTLPHDQFIAKLKSFTNLRVVPDSNS
jgi:hypothetical protein